MSDDEQAAALAARLQAKLDRAAAALERAAQRRADTAEDSGGTVTGNAAPT